MDSLISKLFNFWKLIEQEARNKRAFPMHLMSAPCWLLSRMEQNVTAVYVGQPSGNLKIKKTLPWGPLAKRSIHGVSVSPEVMSSSGFHSLASQEPPLALWQSFVHLTKGSAVLPIRKPESNRS